MPRTPQDLTSPLPSRRLGDDAIFGHGGILGPPAALDSTDPLYAEYLEQVRRRIKEKWGYPCVLAGSSCEYKSTSLEADFGILKNGRLQFVEIVRSADFPIHDEYATNAIKLASPFPPVAPALMAAMRPGSTGMPIRARFIYQAPLPLGFLHLLPGAPELRLLHQCLDSCSASATSSAG